MSRPSRIVVLAEDQRHQRFIRNYLDRLGYTRHDMHFEVLPEGRGSGEQWVRNRYAEAVRDYRARSPRAETALVVAVDADNFEVGQRTAQLEQELIRGNLNPRAHDERIVHLIPKRNIESWILCLGGLGANEDDDFRGTPNIDERIRAAAEVCFAWARPNVALPQHCLPSLELAITEIRRLE